MSKSVKILTRSALLLALTVIVQTVFRGLIPLPPQISQFVIGSLVNCFLIVACVYVSFSGAVAISVLAPIIAFFMGQLPFWQMIFIVAIGNIVICLTYYLVLKLIRNDYLAFIVAIIVGALFKYATLFMSVKYLAVPFFARGLPEKVTTFLIASFGVPQLITATIGGVVAFMLYPFLKKAINK